jgi:hypothetical protein
LEKQKDFVYSVSKCICGNTSSLELDHIDENWRNNDISNWQVLCSQCHRKKSGFSKKKTKPHTKGYSYRFDKILSITSVGIEDTYDIEMEGDDSMANFVADNFIVHNCRHTISYNKTAYKQFYLFDVVTEDGEYWTMQEVKLVAEEFGILYPQIFSFGKFTEEQIQEFAGKTNLGKIGEGIVLKRDFTNKFGDKAYAKVVTQKFKEDNAIYFGGNNKHSETYWEMYVVNKYCTLARVQKIINKIQPEIDEKLALKHIPRIVGTCYHDMITEEAWEIASKVGTIDFNALKRLANKKFVQIYKDILSDDLSVADQI